jgi:hypothetical protein
VSVQLVSYSPFPLSGDASPSTDVATPPCRIMLLFYRFKTSSLHPLHLPIMLRLVASSSRVKIKALNLHHRRWPPSPDSPTLTIHWYKNIILILVTLTTTQSRLYFSSSLARAPRHQSFTRHRRFLSPSSHAHRPST